MHVDRTSGSHTAATAAETRPSGACTGSTVTASGNEPLDVGIFDGQVAGASYAKGAGVLSAHPQEERAIGLNRDIRGDNRSRRRPEGVIGVIDDFVHLEHCPKGQNDSVIAPPGPTLGCDCVWSIRLGVVAGNRGVVVKVGRINRLL